MHQSLQGATFHIEHIVPRSAAGLDISENLALACPSCNLGKSNRMLVVDPETGHEVALFNPRTQRWDDHLAWGMDRQIVALTATGRATIAALDFNHPRRLRIREAKEWVQSVPTGRMNRNPSFISP
jgi:hypothetical protein